MNKKAFARWGIVALRAIIGLIFIYAGMIKARAPDEFRNDIIAYRLVPPAWAINVAYGLPFFEAIAGFWLLLGWRSRVPVLALLVLSAIFAMIMAQALARGFDLSCGCFGSKGTGTVGMWGALARDLLLIVGTGLVYRAVCTNKP